MDQQTLEALAAVLSRAAASAQSSNQVRDSQNLSAYGMHENAKAAQDRFALAAPGSRLSTSMRASLAGNFSPTKFNWNGPGSGLRGEIPTFSGGVREGMTNLDPQTKELAQQVIHDQLLAQMRGGLSGQGKDYEVQQPPMPGQSSALDKLLGGGSTAAAIAAALGKNGAGGNIDISKLIESIRNRRPGTGDTNLNDPNTFVGPQDPDQFTGPQPPPADSNDFVGPTDPDQFVGPQPPPPPDDSYNDNYDEEDPSTWY